MPATSVIVLCLVFLLRVLLPFASAFLSLYVYVGLCICLDTLLSSYTSVPFHFPHFLRFYYLCAFTLCSFSLPLRLSLYTLVFLAIFVPFLVHNFLCILHFVLCDLCRDPALPSFLNFEMPFTSIYPSLCVLFSSLLFPPHSTVFISSPHSHPCSLYPSSCCSYP